MNESYGVFRKLKEKQSDVMKESRAVVTMQYYELISEMIDSGMYSSQETFLYSVQQFIEEREYITDKQIEVIDNIQKVETYGYGEQPF